MTRFIGFAVMFGMIVAGILSGAALQSFVDPPSVFIVVGVIVGGALASFSPSQISTAFEDGFSGGTVESERAHESSSVFFRLSELSVAAGIVGTLLGLVMMLQQMDDPTAIGPAMAVALLTLLYGIMLSELVFRSFAASILERSGFSAQSESSPFRKNRTGMMIFPLFIVLSAFFTMLLAIADFL
ncbi:MAG: MotA/TolQ/ExbB proton channel family protein [Myxococcota bacterium]|jgi:flagellar motor component MotA|nr:MotA/TolQ/ExbB proton channel family protein [Myxococcota bacterium]